MACSSLYREAFPYETIIITINICLGVYFSEHFHNHSFHLSYSGLQQRREAEGGDFSWVQAPRRQNMDKLSSLNYLFQSLKTVF